LFDYEFKYVIVEHGFLLFVVSELDSEFVAWDADCAGTANELNVPFRA